MSDWVKAGKGLPPRLSDLLHTWLHEKVGNHQIDVVYSSIPHAWSIRVDGILIGWVDDTKCTFELASGEMRNRGEVRRRRTKLNAADPLLFDKLWERMRLLDVDVVATCGYSITEYKYE